MGIRYEKDTILNWVNEMGKFLRLLVDKWEGRVVNLEPDDIEKAYAEFFKKDRQDLLKLNAQEIVLFASTLEPEQIRPLAQMLMYDGLLSQDVNMLEKSKILFEYHMQSSGSFSFEDFNSLSIIDKALA